MQQHCYNNATTLQQQYNNIATTMQQQFNNTVLCAGQPHNPMVNSGAMMSAALILYMVKPELSISEKYEFVHQFFKV